MKKQVFTNIEKLNYYTSKFNKLIKETDQVTRRIEELEEICKHNPDGITFQNWKVNDELVELAKAISHGEEVLNKYRKRA